MGGARRGWERLPGEGRARLPVGRGDAARDRRRTQAARVGREARVILVLGAPSRLTAAAESHQICKSVNLGAQAVDVAEHALV